VDFDKRLELMCKEKAPDLLITAGRPPTLKINGALTNVSKTALTEEQSLKVVKSIMTQRQRDDFDNTKECNFAISRPDLSRFRVSAFTQRDATGMVLLRIETNIPDSESLQLSDILKEVIMGKRGLVLFAEQLARVNQHHSLL